MPTYDYVCRFCDHAFEHFQGIHDALLRKCPECKRHGLKRQFGVGAGVVFKGSGFYETDYKRKPTGDDKPAGDKPAGDKSAGEKSSGSAGKDTPKKQGGKDGGSADKAGDKPA